jgi:hypothetical protein
VAQDDRLLHNLRKLCPITVRDLHAGVAGTAGFHLDQDIVIAGNWAVHFFHCERVLELMQHGGFHQIRLRKGKRKNSAKCCGSAPWSSRRQSD